jgi:hypothetical protein
MKKSTKPLDVLIHSPTKTLFLSARQNEAKTKYKTKAGAIFPVSECETWVESFPVMAIAMPPEISQVVAHGDHAFIVLNRSRDKESGKARLWHQWDANTRTGEWFWMDDCAIVSDELIDRWVELIAFTRHNHKEDTEQYRAYIAQVPEAIRDLCIVRSFNKILATMPLGKDYNEIF